MTTGHADPYCAESLPPKALWPEMRHDRIDGLDYPAQLNCAGALLDAAVTDGHGDRTAFHFPGGRWTYHDLLRESNRMANVLVHDLGLVSGSRVLLRGYNGPMMAACWFGVLKAGGVVVCTMPLLRSGELAAIARKARISLALCDTRLTAECEEAMPAPAHRVVPFGTSAVGSLDAMMAGRPATFANCDTSADDCALIAFTSGTTGEAKGTMHAHRDVLAIADTFSRHVLRPEPDDVFIGSPPLAFTFGLGGLVIFPMRVRASAVLLEQASPAQLLEGIERFRATVCFTAPTAYRAICGLLAGRDVASLRKCVSAGETLPKATYDAWLNATGLRIIDGIGATELLHIFISAAGDDIRPGSTGKVVPGFEAIVVDDKAGQCPPARSGSSPCADPRAAATSTPRSGSAPTCKEAGTSPATHTFSMPTATSGTRRARTT